MLSASTKTKANMVELNRVVIEAERGLYARLAELPDHRKPKVARQELAAILLVCAVAMLAGNHNPTEIAEWAADLPEELRLRLHCRRSPSTGLVVVPSISTLQRTLRDGDRQALDRIVCRALGEALQARRTGEEAAEHAESVASDDGGPNKARGLRRGRVVAARLRAARAPPPHGGRRGGRARSRRRWPHLEKELMLCCMACDESGYRPQLMAQLFSGPAIWSLARTASSSTVP